MNAKHRKTRIAIFSRPTSVAIPFADIEALIKALGGAVFEREGSRVTIELKGDQVHEDGVTWPERAAMRFKLTVAMVAIACAKNHHHLRLLLLGLLIGAPLCSFAEAPPPIAPFDAITWKATMKRKPSTGLRMGVLHLRFESTTLDDVRRAAFVGEIAHHGDAGESAYWLCYTNLGETQTERIWIVAHGEMGGTEHHVTNISAELLPDGGATVDCPALPNNLKPLSLDNSLWLGASKGAAFARFGAPSYQKDAWQSYDFQGKVPGKCEGGGFDLTAWLLLHFQNGRVNSLQVGQVTSC